MVLRTESYRRGFAYSSLLGVVDNILAFVPSVLVAAFFGAQAVTDVYYYCTGLVMLVIAYLNNISVAVMVPEYMRIRIQSGPEDAMRFLNTIWSVGIGLLIVLTFSVIPNPVRFVSFISKFPESTLAENRMLLFCAVPLLPLQAMVSSLNDVLHSHKFFTLPMMSSITNRIMVIAALCLGRTRLGILSMLMGLQISFLLQIVLLVYLLHNRLNWRWRMGWGLVRKETWRNMGLAALGGLASLGSSYVPLMLFTGLTAGEVTGLNIAQRLVGLPMAFLAGQAGAVMGVKMNELFAKGDMENARKTFEGSSVLLAMAMSVISGASWLLAHDLIRVLYQRGAFDARSTAVTASLFGVLAWGLPAMGMNTLVARVFMAGQRIREAFWCQVLGNLAQIAAIAWAIGRWGGGGYPLAFVGFYMLYLVAIVPVFARLFAALQYARVLARCGLVLAVAAGVAVILNLVRPAAMAVGGPLVRIVLMGTILASATLALDYFLPVCPELRVLMGEGLDRLNRWRQRGHATRRNIS